MVDAWLLLVLHVAGTAWAVAAATPAALAGWARIAEVAGAGTAAVAAAALLLPVLAARAAPEGDRSCAADAAGIYLVISGGTAPSINAHR